MIRIGIIGAENSHATAIAKTINVEKLVKGCSVDSIWGERYEFAKKAVEEGNIPDIVKRPRDMLGKVDAVIIDHRHPKYHLPVARLFVEAGIPVFVDKPFAYRSSEAREVLRLARKVGTPITSFSVLPHQQSFRKLKKKLSTLGKMVSGYTYGSCDLKSKYGGVFFYGIHQVEVALIAFGYDVKAVRITRNGKNATGQLFYDDGLIVTMFPLNDYKHGFGAGAIGENGIVQQKLLFDEQMYLNGIRMFTNMFKTGEEPVSHVNILKPIQVLEALEKSVKSGMTEKVS